MLLLEHQRAVITSKRIVLAFGQSGKLNIPVWAKNDINWLLYFVIVLTGMIL